MGPISKDDAGSRAEFVAPQKGCFETLIAITGMMGNHHPRGCQDMPGYRERFTAFREWRDRQAYPP
jgi:hypothetical protein